MYELKFVFEKGDAPILISTAGGESILEIARKANVAIDAPCSGNGSCGKCRVKLLKGETEGLQTQHISDEEFAEGWRLSCCSKPLSDLEVLVPDIASAYRSRMKTADLSDGTEIAVFERLLAGVNEAGISLSNCFRAVDLELEEPSLDDTRPDNERLEKALQDTLGCAVRLPLTALQELPAALRENGFRLRVWGEQKEGCFTVYTFAPYGDESPLCGIGIDIGTTTVCAVLFDLRDGRLLAKASGGNGQIRYGADVINRILEQGKPSGVTRLQNAILQETLLPLLNTLQQEAQVLPHCIVRVAIAANTTMNHLLLGIPADPIRTEPYIPAFFRYRQLQAGALGLPVHPSARVCLAPNIGSYVGGDITAGTFAGLFWNREALSLFIDLGTNGEIVFGNSEFLVSCACSAGPAFEGGDISCGMRATDGAIEACSIDAQTMEPSYRIIGNEKPVGLCGSGIIDLIAELFRCGIINAKGHFVREGARVARDRHGIGRYVLATAAESATGRELSLNEIDIDNFIRAKAAIYSAIDTLLSAMDMDESVLEGIYVAGGIGSGINISNAIRIGMFPKIPLEQFHYIGNSSLAGAYTMALSEEAENRVSQVAENMTYMELSTHPGYMDSFVAACFLPHTDASRFS